MGIGMANKRDPEMCYEFVPTPGMRWGYHQCTKPVRVVAKDGHKYCKVHDPEEVKRRHVESSRKFDEKFERETRPAQLYPEFIAFLRYVVKLSRHDADSISKLKSMARKLLQKAKETE